jgi:transcriptional regulator with GAF, ATPase, and Fis domain/serine/threonine protein kinase
MSRRRAVQFSTLPMNGITNQALDRNDQIVLDGVPIRLTGIRKLVDARCVKFPGYRNVVAIRSGNHGQAFRAIDIRTGSAVFIKCSASQQNAPALVDEFACLRRIAHRNVAQILDMSVADDGLPFVVTQWVDGIALAHAVVPSQHDLGRYVIHLLHDIGSALAAIAEAGFIHGDVAPQNIIVGHVRDHQPPSLTLVDLGFASMGMASDARGTPLTMAPEAWAGLSDGRSDMYSLGVCAIVAVTGSFPNRGTTISEIATAAIAGIEVPAVDGLSHSLHAFLTRLVSRTPSARPASAAEMLAELTTIAAVEGVSLPSLPTSKQLPTSVVVAIGHSQEHRQLEAWLRRSPSLLALIEAPSKPPSAIEHSHSGDASALLDSAVADYQIERSMAAPSFAGTRNYVARMLCVSDGVVDLADGIAKFAGTICLWLQNDRQAESLLMALASRELTGHVAVIVASAPLNKQIASQLVFAVDEQALATLCQRVTGHTAPLGWLQQLRDTCNGESIAAYQLLRSLPGHQPFALPPHTYASDDHIRAALRNLQTANPALRQIVVVAAWLGGRGLLSTIVQCTSLSADHIASEVANAGRAIWCEATKLGPAIVVSPLWMTTTRQHTASLVDTWQQMRLQLLLMATDDVEVTTALLLDGDAALDRPDLTLDIAQHHLDRGRPALALKLGQALTLSSDSRACGATAVSLHGRASLLIAHAALALGSYSMVIQSATVANDYDPRAACIVHATALQRSGNLEQALTVLGEAAQRLPADDDIRGAFARASIAAGHYQRAADIAAPAAQHHAKCAECAGLADYYLGRYSDAANHFAQLESVAQATHDQHLQSRASSLLGMVDQQRGDLTSATDRYTAAIAMANASGQLHVAATAQSNLGAVLCDRGIYGDALVYFSEAAQAFEHLGAWPDVASADVNRANVLRHWGEFDRAMATIAQLRARPNLPTHVDNFANVIEADMFALQNQTARALLAYQHASDVAREQHDARAAVAADLGLYELQGGPPSERVAAIARRDITDADSQRAQLAIARQLGPHTPSQRHQHAQIAARVGEQAEQQGRIETQFRAFAVAAILLRDHDNAGAATYRDRSQQALSQLLMRAPASLAQRWQQDSDAIAIASTATARATPNATDSEAPWLRRLLGLSRRLASESSVDRMLADALDTAIEVCQAERGFILLRRNDDFSIEVARGFASNAGSERDFSSQIARQAAQSAVPVITIDAGTDNRFDGSESVAALRLRSVLAVPLLFRGESMGCVYLDHRLRHGAFDEDAAIRLHQVADIAAPAIGNATLSREIAVLNRQLEQELNDREHQLAKARTVRDATRDNGQFPELLGDSPALVAMLDVVSRASVTSLPVVIVGESGTGKELVARALHQHGPRRDKPFVAINCGALPDQLLESELFGHTRGAFTGALRDRAGVFELADGGTLFLDEIADTSMAMQTKLLRVLQDGSLRRLGDSNPRVVDVRVIAASQVPLSQLVSDGQFRDDLRYRLDVITIAVPALRDRATDILPLATAFAQRVQRSMTTASTASFSRAAERSLLSYSWPGNVRELENVVARAVAMGGAIIDSADLPSHVAAATTATTTMLPLQQDLRLRTVVDALESAYIAEALSRCHGNQSAAAKLLGLSRFGLQKKMRRLAQDASDSMSAPLHKKRLP